MNEPQQQRPTGFSPTTLPLYQELDDAEFEEFCTALLNLHPLVWCQRDGRAVERRILSASRLLSGNAQRGADIRADVEGGEVWMFQCKHVQRFNPGDVTAAVRLLEEGFPHADQYVLVTTSGLKLEGQGEAFDRPRWAWWDSSRLTQVTQQVRPTEDAIKLVHQFFGLDWVRKLFPWGDQPLLTWQEFFSHDLAPDRRHFHHHTPFVPFGDTLVRLEAFAKTGKGRALVLSAGGGLGKSRLLLELARSLESQADAPHVRFLNLRQNGLSESQADFLSRAGELRELLLVVDDAHRLDAAIGELAKAVHPMEPVRLLIATRPQAIESVNSQLYRNGYAERIEEPLRPPAWKQTDMVQLAERILDPGQRVHAPRLAALADRCPLLVVLGGAQINAGAFPEVMTDEEAFRERVFKGFIEDFLKQQPETTRERHRRLMRLLSFLSPTPKDHRLLEHSAEVLDCRTLDVAEDIEALMAAGLVVENREGIRLYPDLFADAVLLDACLDQGGRISPLFRHLLDRLPIAEFPAVLRNVAQADWEARTRTGAKDSLFDPIWNQFSERFAGATWDDRRELLTQWAGFAMFQPERTLELAALAMKAETAPENGGSWRPKSSFAGRVGMLGELPALLEPVVVWHPERAGLALDMLWALHQQMEPDAKATTSNAITAIARAAAFEVHKPLAASESVIVWLEGKLSEGDGIERIRRQPWILSAVLSPFFGRVVELHWQTGMTLHLAALPIHVERTKRVRQRALALIERFASLTDAALVHAAVPALREALNPIYPRAGFEPTEEIYAEWRPERLEALEVARRVSGVHSRSHLVLLQLRQRLAELHRYDPDAQFKAACGELLATIPDSLEIRLARALTSWPWVGVGDSAEDKGPGGGHQTAERRFSDFCFRVARELAELGWTPEHLCAYLAREVDELTRLGQTLNLEGLGHALASLEAPWCGVILDRLLAVQDSTLDAFLPTFLLQAVTSVPEVYEKALVSLPADGDPGKLIALIYALGQKHRDGQGLTEVERDAVLQATQRREPDVLHALAWAAGYRFDGEPKWAMAVLRSLKPSEDHGAGCVLRALAGLIQRYATGLGEDDVLQCLENLGERCLGAGREEFSHSALLASKFPVAVYEHLSRQLDSLGATDASHFVLNLVNKTPGFGRFANAAYLDREFLAQWTQALADRRTRAARLALARSLLWSDAEAAPERLRALIHRCASAEELQLALGIGAAQGSRFVFQFPELAREVLTRAAELKDVDRVLHMLRDSALGGARGYTGGDLDPEYRYLIDQSELLANKYRDDPILGRLYGSIAETERRHLDRHREEYRATLEAGSRRRPAWRRRWSVDALRGTGTGERRRRSRR